MELAIEEEELMDYFLSLAAKIDHKQIGVQKTSKDTYYDYGVKHTVFMISYSESLRKES